MAHANTHNSKPLRIIVTGASSGLGRALAVEHARRGDVVGAVARRADLLDELTADPVVEGRILPLTCDITDPHAIEQAVHRFNLEQGGLDVFYANAGIGQSTVEEGWNPDRARQIAEVNVVGSTNAITAALAVMLEQGQGRVVGISSLAGSFPLPHAAAYGASKSWMVFYLRSLELDLADSGVKFTVVMPGHIPTPMVDGDTSDLLTPGARRAARLIMSGIETGKRTIRFPRKVALFATLASWLPAGLRARIQRQRLAKRKSMRK